MLGTEPGLPVDHYVLLTTESYLQALTIPFLLIKFTY